MNKYEYRQPPVAEIEKRQMRGEKIAVIVSSSDDKLPFNVVVKFPDVAWDCHAHIMSFAGLDCGAFVVEHEDLTPKNIKELIPYKMANHKGLDSISDEWKQMLVDWADKSNTNSPFATNWDILQSWCIYYASAYMYISAKSDDIPFLVCTKLPDENGSNKAYIVKRKTHEELGSFIITKKTPRSIKDIKPFNKNFHTGLDYISKDWQDKLIEWANRPDSYFKNRSNWDVLKIQIRIGKESYPEFN